MRSILLLIFVFLLMLDLADNGNYTKPQFFSYFTPPKVLSDSYKCDNFIFLCLSKFSTESIGSYFNEVDLA